VADEAFTPPGVRTALTVLGLTLAAYTVQAGFALGGSGVAEAFATWVYTFLAIGATAVCLARVVLVKAERAAWSAFFVGLASWTTADVLWLVAPSAVAEPPLLWLTDVLYLTMYPAFYCGLILLMRSRLRPFRASLWLDGLAGGLAVAALAAALVLEPILRDTSGSTYETVVALAYPLGDLLLVVVAIAAIGMTGWRPGGAWALVAIGGIAGAAADTVYLYRTAAGTWADGSVVDVAWSAAMLVTAMAAWRPLPSRNTTARPGWRTIGLPAGFALCSLAVLVLGNTMSVSPAATVLAAAGLLAALARAGLTYLENVRMLRRREDEAMTDGLSGLPNRRRLMADLELVVDEPHRPTTLVFFDLNGFKHYNDTFGHGAGDSLLARLGAALAAALKAEGRAYRLGGDEFCALLEGRHQADGPMVHLAAAALSETGGGFSVTASYGVVVLPDEATNANEALGLADERMYGQKRSGRFSSRQQARSVLLQVQSEREPDVHTHANSVTDLALMVGRCLDLEPDAMDVLARAAELHDIGKVAIPEEILRKPGPLTEGEWAFVRQHTIIGERILAAAPALASVGHVVRASHERWDGAGYPDGLAGEQIPRPARIVNVCDAFDAMVSDRPYQGGMPIEDALTELERCAGSQFDPAVVRAFVEAVAHQGVPVSGRRATRAA
jgi:two-component system, cell cycle response regulator